MGLPKVQTPTFSLNLPSNGQKIVYRPFQVREEKMLLIAQQSNETDDQIRTIKQIIGNCIVEPSDIEVEKMASFDIEYLFLKLRAKSVGEIVEIKVIPQKRDNLPPMDMEINLDELEPTINPKHTNMIDIGGGIQIQMQYPTFEMVTQLSNTNDTESLFNLFQESMTAIYEGDEVYETKDFSNKEVQEFLESLSSKQLVQLQEFFTTLPKIRKEIEYRWTNPDDPSDTHKETIVLEGLLSFLS